MLRINQPLIPILLAYAWGCDQSPQESVHDQTVSGSLGAANPSDPAELYRVVALRAYDYLPSDLEKTATYYRDHPSEWLTPIDLDLDGTNEAIVTTTFAVDGSGELHLADGVTGNRPFNVFHEQGGEWVPMMQEDF
ncbi:MAG: hypothetical protein AAGI37_03675 [Planctomycetota bacterium]